MPKKRSRRWTTHEIQLVRAYVRDHAVHIISNMYKNIFAGSIKHPKSKGFYKHLSAIVKRSLAKCKSKFQKMERHLYVDVLRVPVDTFELFLWTRFKSSARSEHKRFVRTVIAKKRSWHLRKSRARCWAQSDPSDTKFIRDSRKYDRATRRLLEDVRLDLIAKWLGGDPGLPEVTSSGSLSVANAKPRGSVSSMPSATARTPPKCSTRKVSTSELSE